MPPLVGVALNVIPDPSQIELSASEDVITTDGVILVTGVPDNFVFTVGVPDETNDKLSDKAPVAVAVTRTSIMVVSKIPAVCGNTILELYDASVDFFISKPTGAVMVTSFVNRLPDTFMFFEVDTNPSQ